MPFDTCHFTKHERRNDFHEAATYFVGRTCGGPAKVRYDGQGVFTDLVSGRAFAADIRKLGDQQCAIHPDFDAIFSKDSRVRAIASKERVTVIGYSFRDCTTDAERHALVIEYISGHTSGAASHSSLIRVFGKAVTDVVNGMAASGLLCRFRKATTQGRANTYFAIPGTPTE